MSRFGDWEEKSEIETKVNEPAKEPEVKAVAEEGVKDDASTKTETKVENGDDPKHELTEEQRAIEALKREAFKLREKRRAEKAARMEAESKLQKLESESKLDVSDFDSYEDYEKAKKEIKPESVKADPKVIKAVSAINKRLEKAGFDVKEVTDALSDMEYLPDEAVIALADHEDAAQIAKWISENEDDDVAQAALNALTDHGRMRAFDRISAKLNKTPETKQKREVETITRMPGSAKTRDLSELSTDEFVEARRGDGNRRGFW